MKDQILVYIDGVLADIYSQFIQWEFRDCGVLYTIESLYGKSEAESFVNYEKYVRSLVSSALFQVCRTA